MSVVPKNRQLVFSIRNYIRDTSEIFSISPLVKISLTLLLCFSFVFRLGFCFLKHPYQSNKQNLHVDLKILSRHRVISFLYKQINYFLSAIRSKKIPNRKFLVSFLYLGLALRFENYLRQVQKRVNCKMQIICILQLAGKAN